jgi:FkbM family methyltransferase
VANFSKRRGLEVVKLEPLRKAFFKFFKVCQALISKRSFSFYQTQNFVVEDRAIRLPVANGIGIDLIGEGKHSLSDLIAWVYDRRTGAFIDVGANVGRVLVALLRYDRSIPYVGFDPMIACARHVDAIIRENGLTDSHSILPVGLSDKSCSKEMFFDSVDDVSATAVSDARPARLYRTKCRIALGVGDDYLSQIPTVAFIKIDAEGSEPRVLRGLQKTITQHKPVICFEVLPIKELERGTHPLFDIDDDEKRRLLTVRKNLAEEIKAVLDSYDYEVVKFAEGKMIPGADLAGSSISDYDFVAIPKCYEVP